MSVDRTAEDASLRDWWRDRQARFNIVVAAGYILVAVLSELGVLGRVDHIGWSPGALILYGVGIGFFVLIANLVYFLVASTEKLVKPKNVSTFRRYAFGSAFVISMALPTVWILIP